MDAIEKSFFKAPRQSFVLDELESQAHTDKALPIGFGQTISQPTTVQHMIEWLEIEPGQKVLDVGSGSGWTSAILSNLVGPKGRVYAVERIPELLEMGKRNCDRLNIKNIIFKKSSTELGLPKFSPFDRILVSAAANELPLQLLEQLLDKGVMVIPVKNAILQVRKAKNSNLEIIQHPGYVFVPLIY